MQNLKIKIYNKSIALSLLLTPVLPVVAFVIAGIIFTHSNLASASGDVVLSNTFPSTADYEYQPVSMATDSSGNVYVTDYGTTIRKYDSSANLLAEIDTGVYVAGIAIDSSNNIFIEDDYNYAIKKFDSAGTLLASWGQSGTANGEFTSFGGIAVDSNGNVFVSDSDAHRVQKFDNNGNYITKWGTQGSGNGQFQYPYKMSSDSAGNIFVTDVFNYRIQKFNSSGVYQTKWGQSGSGDGQFTSYIQGGLAVAPGGNVYIADTYAHRIQEFTNGGVFVRNFVNYTFTQFVAAQDLTVYGNRVYVADTGRSRIMVFDKTTHEYLLSWGSSGSGDGQFGSGSVRGIEADSLGNIYTLDGAWDNPRVQKFDSNGNYILQWGAYGSGDGQFISPNGIAIDTSDNIYVLDTSGNRIQKFDSNGSYILQWGSPGNGDGEFYLDHWVDESNGITTDSHNNVYVSDSGNARIQKFDSNGSYILQWGSFGDSGNQFKYQRGIAADAGDNIYVLDVWAMSRNQLKKFDSSGNLLKIAQGANLNFSNGNNDDQYPQNLEVGDDGMIYVIDTGASDIKVLDYASQLSIDTTWLPDTNYGQSYSASLAISDPEGPVAFSIVSGSLPDGLSLDPDSGQITGNPTDTYGDFTSYFSVQATDGVTTTSPVNLSIYSQPVAHVQIASAYMDDADLNEPYDETIYAWSGGYGPITFSIVSGSLPDGLSLDPDTGQITGTPTVKGVYNFVVMAEDDISADTANLSITVVSPPIADISIRTSLLSPGITPNQSAQYTVALTNHGPESFVPGISGHMIFALILIPDELQYTGYSGSGFYCMQAVHPYSYPLDQYENDGQLVSCVWPYSYVPQLSPGGSVSMTFSVQAGGTIGDDITVKTVGMGYGDPSFDIIDSTMSSGNDIFELQNNSICGYSGIHPGSCDDDISITTTSLPDAIWTGANPDAYSQQVSTTRDPYMSYAITSGALPSGLSMSPGGLISGNPAATPGTYSFTVEARENTNKVATRQLSIVVPNPPVPPPVLYITTTQLSDGTVGQYYSDYIYAADVYQAVTYSLISGSLPAGLSLRTIGNAGNVYGTPTTEGQWTFTVQAQDGANTDQRTYFISVYEGTIPTVPPAANNEKEDSKPPQEEVKPRTPVSGTEPLGHAEGLTSVQGKKRHLSPIAERLVVFFPWFVIILLGVVAAVYTLQAVAQNRAAKRLRSDLEHQEQLVHEKKNFMALASHYMRTPLTIIKSAVELAIHDVPLEHVGTVQGALSQLEARVGGLVDDIGSDAALQQIVPPGDLAYRQSRPWSPQVLLPVSVAVVSLVMGWLLTSYYTFITQSIATRIIIGFSILLLIGVLYLLSEWHKRTVFETARAEQLEMYQMSIDRARNGFISSAAESIAQPLADFEECFKNPQIAEALQKGPALKMILRAVDELRGTISKFALAGELEHKMVPVQPQTVTAGMLTAPAIQKVTEAHPTVEVQSTLPPEHLYALEAPSLFANAFENVVENAANYNISPVPVVVAQEQAGEQIAITVEDHGVGIEPGKLSALFKPFGRAEDAEDFSHQGIGMGLYLTRLILDYLGGSVSAESQPGKGTKVRLSLPHPAK